VINTGFKYQLEQYRGASTRHTCPRCGTKRNFVRYINTDGNYIGDEYGRCNSEVSCAYHNPPSGNIQVEGGFIYEEKEPTFLSHKHMLLDRHQDNLYKFLITKYDEKDVLKAYSKYEVCSTQRKWRDSTVFYQKDFNGKYRTGKIIQYNDSGKRVKHPYSRIYWVHNLIHEFDFVLEQCLFGEYLLNFIDDRKDIIYLVESEKTCVIASINYPNKLFLATGGLSNLSPKKLEILKSFNVEAIPDKGGYDIWKTKLQPLGIAVNTVMEESDCPDGSDFADLLLNEY